ncbi:DUF4079 domain-containing protein [filamentous cyanobacterium LEGE 11480]|uniref:DUF4079 domain-containing protein n=1 Tax=Romeriopsis navalis LEGE 11480 TaxID=2777977 RepID=A0A928VQE6_9CYAN|nr:DUF4079 domain-containing protein [Romeriopsis navalis]MBE9031016.1 DUF4079 domain-containing protein [Romeriopsis navalis LEGE 11480]
MTFADWLRLVHPILAVVVVYPLIGIVVRYAWQTRQRRLEAKAKIKSKIPPTAGAEHVNIGRWLTGSVTGLSLLGLAHPIFKTIVKKQVWAANPGQVIFIVLMFAATIASLVFLYRAKTKGWRVTFTTLTSAGLIILGLQDGVFRRTDEWFFSHYYYGLTAAILMVISLAILPEIYRQMTWRKVHIGLNIIALLLFLGQGVTGARDLLEIPLSWQEPTVFSCDFANKVCGAPPSIPN